MSAHRPTLRTLQRTAVAVLGVVAVMTLSTVNAGASLFAPSPAAPAAAVPTPLAPGSAGPEVLDFEQRLAGLRFDVGVVDGTFDEVTASAVMAFQKVNGMARTGEASSDTITQVRATTTFPPALAPGGGANRVEIDLTRQVLFLYEGDVLSRILPVSTGSGETFCDGGPCRQAVTPVGSFAIYRQVRGWDHGPLGALYNPQYFEGGIAIHGSESVPATPASHGCVRIPLSAAEWFPSHVSVGTPVFVAGG